MSARSRRRRSSPPGTTSWCSTTSRPAIARPCRTGRGCIVGSYGDGATVTRLLTAEDIEAILHCAARSLVSESIEDPARYFRDNVAGGITLLEAAREVGVDRVVFSSTAAVYGVPDSTPITEDAPLRPINPYGETKRSFEGALAWYARAYGMRSVTLRYFNVAGATEALGEDHDPETHLIPAILGAVEAGRPVTLFGGDYPTPDGTCIRDYIHVADLADAHLRAIEATARDDSRTAERRRHLQPRQRRRVQQPRGARGRRTGGRRRHPARDRPTPAGRPAGPRGLGGSGRRDPRLAPPASLDR